MTKNNKIISGVLVVAAIAGLIWYIYRDYKYVSNNSNNAGETENQNITGTGTTTVNIGGIEVGGDGNYTLEQVPIDEPQIQYPSLLRQVVIPESFGVEGKKIMQYKINTVTDALKNDPRQIRDWTTLAIYRKTINDHEGAKIIWEFLKTVDPSNTTHYASLGDLYGYYFKNISKAEENFLIAIEKGPSAVYVYYQTAMFYKDVMNDVTKARAIVDRGLKQMPGNEELKTLQRNLAQ